jgi:hypothetical protein
MAAGYAEQWAEVEALAKGDLGLEDASPQEALARIKDLRLPVREAIMLGANAAKRDWCKLCALEQELEEECGLDNWDTDPDDVIEAASGAARTSNPKRRTPAPRPPAQISDEDLLREIENGHRADYLSSEEATAIFEFCKEHLDDAVRLKLGQWKNPSLQAPKLIFADKDADGWFPQYQFGVLAKEDYHRRISDITGTPLQGLLQKMNHDFGVEVTNFVANCCKTFATYLPSHKDQTFSLQSARSDYETEASVFNYSVGATRNLWFIRDTGAKGLWGKKSREELQGLGTEIFKEVALAHNSLNVMTGPVNAATLHMLPVEESQGKPEELRFSVTGRAAKRLLVNLLLREYKVYKQGKWEQGKLPEPKQPTERKRPLLEDGPAEKKRSNTGAKAASGSKEEVVDPPPFPDMPEIRRVLNMPGPPLVQGTGEAKKLVENRATRMPLGDYVLRCANSKDWKKDLKVLEQQINQLPYEEGSLDHLRGKAVYMVRLAEHRTPEQCNGHPWAIGPVCHVITHVKWLKEPVDIPQKGQGPFIKLYAEKPKKPEQALCHRTIAEKVYEQVKDRDWIELDTSPLDAPALPNRGTSTSAGSSSSAGSGGASAADGTSPAGPETIDNTQAASDAPRRASSQDRPTQEGPRSGAAPSSDRLPSCGASRCSGPGRRR